MTHYKVDGLRGFLIKCEVNHLGVDLATLGSIQVPRNCVGGGDHIPIGAFLGLFGIRLHVTLLRRWLTCIGFLATD